ncbi:CrcB protein [Anabaenopsis circularis NIES-21]|uniref:Fluoride-specific ion channel FluC n=2 Tax=Nostocales TaxID=1161 RepID=A0A1Z4GCB1_9CYAN|nr:fluoride efflux transporter CrcB [Nostoc cycadae]BAY15119.1 CrcB protein [Anabaenopsis circularis NIES-21]GBE91546.1 chromosome condensation protein CrcB [Nostoc cycadae WK-1]
MNSIIEVPLLISVGAIPGALSRYYLTILFGRWFGIAFPYGTLFINVTGAFLMGFFATLVSKLAIPSNLSLLIAVGFLGSYTTFSTYALDTSNLLRTRNYKATLLYWVSTPILGFMSIEMGIFLANLL